MTELTQIRIGDLIERLTRVIKEDAETLSDELLGSNNARRISQRLFFLRQEFFRRMGGDSHENQKLLNDLERAIPGYTRGSQTAGTTYAYFTAKRYVLERIKDVEKNAGASVKSG